MSKYAISTFVFACLCNPYSLNYRAGVTAVFYEVQEGTKMIQSAVVHAQSFIFIG